MRCRLALARGWRSSQAFVCSPIKRARELGSNRRETGWSLPVTGADLKKIYTYLREVDPSTRGPD